MANKPLQSIKFPGLSDTYVVPQIDDTLTQTGQAADAGAVRNAVDTLTDSLYAKSYNLVNCDSSDGWKIKDDKDVTVSCPQKGTIRVTSNIEQTYATAYFVMDVTGIDTVYTSFEKYEGTGATRTRLYTAENGIIGTNLGTVTKAKKQWDVSEYNEIAIEISATLGTAQAAYYDYTHMLVTAEDTDVYIDYYVPKLVSKEEFLTVEDEVDAVLSAVTPASKKIIYHRGARATAPENTMPAFIKARSLGAVYVETDIRYTSDNVPVLLHDATINRTARNADGTQIASTVNIADITYEQALTYDFGVYAGQQYAGTKIPTLAEFLRWCKITGCIPVLEQKIREVATVNSTIQALQQEGITERFAFLCYGLGSLDTVHNSLPDGEFLYIRTAALTQQDIADASAKSWLTAIDADVTKTTQEMIDACKTANVPLFLFGYTNFTSVYNTDDYVSGYTIEEGAI